MTTDLSYLEAMTEGDKGLITELIGIFSTQVKEYSKQMQIFRGENNWKELSKLAHKAKSSVAIMGMKELAEKMKQLELLASKEEETDTYSSYIDHFTSECDMAVSELQHYK
jgi:HPt (histidine-containing phosphotransfer) domain-containing protein